MSASRFRAVDVLLPLLAVVGSLVSLSVGQALAKRLFPLVSAEGTVAYRIGFSLLLLGLIWRPWRWSLARTDLKKIAAYGVTLGVMNLMFYQALLTVPLGVATAIEFSGPLVVAVVFSRRLIDFAWVALAFVGLALLLPFRSGMEHVDPRGAAFAVGAATCWALYIVFTKRISHLHPGQTVSLGLVFASLVALPIGIAGAGASLLVPSSMALGLAVAALSSAIPYSLEMFALRRLSKQAFSVTLSMDPAMAAVAGLAILGERLSIVQWVAVASTMVASVGMAFTSERETVPAGAEIPPA
ncbi:EamA family transporter [bacterium]|nr:MAG: EamA family transporter [bacterium]